MAKPDHIPLTLRIVIEQPVADVLHSLQSKDDIPLDPKRSIAGEALSFEMPIRIAPGPKFFGDQVRREGPERRFVYVRIGQSAGEHGSPWTRRMKIDIHDIPQALIDKAIAASGVVEITVGGTDGRGEPACATVVTGRRVG